LKNRPVYIWMLELARRKSSTSKLYRRVKKDPAGATRLDRRCLVPDEPNTNHFRRRLEHDDLICIAQNCAHNGAIGYCRALRISEARPYWDWNLDLAGFRVAPANLFQAAIPLDRLDFRVRPQRDRGRLFDTADQTP
jgi:hypothetical protein